MDKTLADLFTAWWESGDADHARVLADALTEAGVLDDRLADLSAVELADVLQSFRAAVMLAPALAAAFNRIGVALGEAIQGVARMLAGEPVENFPP